MIKKLPPSCQRLRRKLGVLIYLAVLHRLRHVVAAIISGLLMGFAPVRLVKAYGETIRICAYSLITISAMLAIGTLTRLSGIDATLGLAFAGTGVLYPFFGTLARLG